MIDKHIRSSRLRATSHWRVKLFFASFSGCLTKFRAVDNCIQGGSTIGRKAIFVGYFGIQNICTPLRPSFPLLLWLLTRRLPEVRMGEMTGRRPAPLRNRGRPPTHGGSALNTFPGITSGLRCCFAWVGAPPVSGVCTHPVRSVYL